MALIFVIFCFFSCDTAVNKEITINTNDIAIDSIKYSIVSSKVNNPILSYDEKGKFLDTIIPLFIKSIRDEKYYGIPSKDGLIKDALTAKKMALIVLESFFSKKQIQSEEPIDISLIDDKYWFVYGSLPEGSYGGVMEILISKADGRILYLSHGK